MAKLLLYLQLFNDSSLFWCLYNFLELFLDPLTWLFYMLMPVLVQIDCDKTIMVTLKHDDKLQDGSECAFQVACPSVISFL